MKTFYTILVLAMVFTGCKTTSSDAVPATFSSSAETGLAAGTITFDGGVPKNDIYRFFYSPVSDDKKTVRKNKGKVQILGRVDDARAYTGDFNDKKTYLFVIERKPGAYAFTEYNVLNRIGYSGMVNFSPKFSIPFEIKKGEIKYIGNLIYNENSEKATPRIIVTDYMERDLPEFKKKFPAIQWEQMTNNTVKKGDTGAGIIDFK